MIVVLLIILFSKNDRYTPDNSTIANNKDDISNLDVAILLGDEKAYYRSHQMLDSGKITVRDYIIYSLIMADKYGSHDAAYQLVNTIHLDYDTCLDDDTSLVLFLIPYLNFVVDNADPLEYNTYSFAIFNLYDIYSGSGHFGRLAPNQRKMEEIEERYRKEYWEPMLKKQYEEKRISMECYKKYLSKKELLH